MNKELQVEDGWEEVTWRRCGSESDIQWCCPLLSAQCSCVLCFFVVVFLPLCLSLQGWDENTNLTDTLCLHPSIHHLVLCYFFPAQLWDAALRVHGLCLCCGKASFTGCCAQQPYVCLAPGGHVLNNESVLYSVLSLISQTLVRFTGIIH